MRGFALSWFVFVSVASADPVVDALVEAAYRDDLVKVRSLVADGSKPDAPNSFGANSLAMACINGNAGMLEFLLEKGGSANSRSSGEPLLVAASRAGDAGCVAILLNHGADANAHGNRKQTALMWAAANGHDEAVSMLLAKGANPATRLDSGFDAMLFAVRGGHSQVVKQLVKTGVPIDGVYSPENGNGKSLREGTSPLMLAIENGHFELASELLGMGSDPNDMRSGFAPLHALTWVRKSERGDGPEGTPPPRGSGNISSLDFATRLIDAGADVNIRSEVGGAGPANLNYKGATPSLLASKSCDLEYLQLLLKHGADPRMHNVDDTSPLLTAAGIGVTAPGEEQAMEEDSLAVIAFLLDLGLDINHVDKRGDTVMHAAAYKSSPAVIQLLDQRGADIRVWHKKNRKGWTPLLIAQGFRPGNFRPIQYTEEAIAAVMRRYGVEPEPSPPPPGLETSGETEPYTPTD